MANVTVEQSSTSNNSISVRLIWNEPENPNGMILSYNIRYQRVDKHAKYQEICIPQKLYQEQGKSHIIIDLVDGNYSFIIAANSLAGLNTRWSNRIYFEVDKTTISSKTLH